MTDPCVKGPSGTCNGQPCSTAANIACLTAIRNDAQQVWQDKQADANVAYQDYQTAEQELQAGIMNQCPS